MKKFSVNAGLVSLLLLSTITTWSCGEKKAETTAEEIKSEMPAELKDSTVLQQEEASAIDKLNAVIDSSEKK